MRLETKTLVGKNFIMSIIVVKEVICYFKDENRKSEKK